MRLVARLVLAIVFLAGLAAGVALWSHSIVGAILAFVIALGALLLAFHLRSGSTDDLGQTSGAVGGITGSG